MPNYSLFLDDIRFPHGVNKAWHKGKWIDFPSQYNWIVVRSFKEFTDCIIRYMLPLRVAFDHDLSYEDQNKTEGFTEKTGLDAAKWLVEYCDAKNLPLPEWFVHSFNPVGRMNIANYLTCYERFKQMPQNPEGPKIIVP